MAAIASTLLRRLRAGPAARRLRAGPAARRLAVSSTSVTRFVRAFSTDAPSSDVVADAVDAPLLPAHIKFRMPDLDFEQISGGGASGGVTLSKWHVAEGDAIRDGAHMCEIDTPDLVFVLDAGDEGFLARILVPAETKDVPPGQPLAIIVPTEEDVAAFRAALQQHPRAIEGYVEPTDAETSAAGEETHEAGETASTADKDDGAAVLRALSKLHKEGNFADDAVYKALKSLARKNDPALLVTFKGSFDGDAFDADFFVETATELADEALQAKETTSS